MQCCHLVNFRQRHFRNLTVKETFILVNKSISLKLLMNDKFCYFKNSFPYTLIFFFYVYYTKAYLLIEIIRRYGRNVPSWSKNERTKFCLKFKNKGKCILQESEKTDLITDLVNHLSKICSFQYNLFFLAIAINFFLRCGEQVL